MVLLHGNLFVLFFMCMDINTLFELCTHTPKLCELLEMGITISKYSFGDGLHDFPSRKLQLCDALNVVLIFGILMVLYVCSAADHPLKWIPCVGRV